MQPLWYGQHTCYAAQYNYAWSKIARNSSVLRIIKETGSSKTGFENRQRKGHICGQLVSGNVHGCMYHQGQEVEILSCKYESMAQLNCMFKVL